MPVAFLEPQLNEYNACSVYTTKSPRERASKLYGARAAVRGYILLSTGPCGVPPWAHCGPVWAPRGRGFLELGAFQIGESHSLWGPWFVVWILRSGGDGLACPDPSLHPSPGAP